MAAENKNDELSSSQTDADGHCEYSNSVNQGSPVLQTGASVDQSFVTTCSQTPSAGATSVQVLPAVHVAGHPLTVCMANSVSTTGSFSAYTRCTTSLSPGDKQGNRPVYVSPVQQLQNVVTRTAPTVHQAAQPTAVLDLGNNGILNAVLGRLPNIGTMVVHSLDPGSLIQKNIVAMIDSRTSAVTAAPAAVPVINLQPVLTLSHQRTMPLQHPRPGTGQITQQVSQASGLRHSVVNQIGLREPLVGCSVPAEQHVAFTQPSVTVINSGPPQPPSLNPSIMRHTVMVRPLASSTGHTHQSLSLSPSFSSQFPLVNSTYMIPQIRLPHTASSVPPAVVRYHTTTSAQIVQQSTAVLANQSATQIQPNMSLPLQAQLVPSIPSVVTELSKNAFSGSSTDIESSSLTLPPSESLTTIIPAKSVTIPFAIPQSAAKAATDRVIYSLLTPSSPSVSGSTAAVCQTGVSTSAANLAVSLIQIATCTNTICNSKQSASSVFSSHRTFASYVPASVPTLPVHRFPVSPVPLCQGQVNCATVPKKSPVKRPPRRKRASVACPVSGGHGTNVNQPVLLKQLFHSSAVGGVPIASLTESVEPMMVDSSQAVGTHVSTGTLLAGVKRKCVVGERYTLLLENGCKYPSVYFDGAGFRAKKPCISPALTEQSHVGDVHVSPTSAKNVMVYQPKLGVMATSTAGKVIGATTQVYCSNCNILNSGATCMKCARPLQSLSQILLRGDTVSKPLILLPTPNSSASLTSVGGLLASAFQPRTVPSIVRTTLRKSATRRPKRAQKKHEPEVVHILSSDDEEDKAATSVATGMTQSTSAACSVVTSLTHQGLDVGKSVVVSQPLTLQASDVPPLSIRARSVRIGSVMLQRVQQCTFFVKAIRITFTPEGSKGISNLPLLSSEMRSMFIHLGPQGPVVFLLMSAECGKRIRNILGLMEHCSGYYDPESDDDSLKYVTIIPAGSFVLEADMLAIVSLMQSSCEQSSKFVYKSILAPEAQQLLYGIYKTALPCTAATAAASTVVRYSTPVTTVPLTAARLLITRPPGGIVSPGPQIKILVGSLDMLRSLGTRVQTERQYEEEEMADRSRSPSPPHPIFNGPVVRLFTYPPPPATGGIAVTNEDFYCLNDGEFLNDVIIDFYFKYLFLEVLSDADRARTHIFSSFFYRRLTQKQTRGIKDEDAANKTLAQRRHLRVKTWTRHVDLFNKDFVMVPINESAHWYLAVICFAGLREPVSNVQQMAEKDADSTTAANTEVTEGADQPAKVVTPVADGEDAKPTYKQPCILIFDSLMSQHYGVVHTLREYLQEEWNARKRSTDGERQFDKDNMKASCVKCPQQSNFSDCGIYVLQYAESFFMKPIASFAFPFAPLLNWFPEADVLKKRETLRQLVRSLQTRLNPDLQWDLQQGTAPPAPAMPETSAGDMSIGDECVSDAGTAALLNPVETELDADSASLLQTDSESFDANEHKLSEEFGNCVSESVLSVTNSLLEHDVADVIKSTSAQAVATAMTAQTVTASMAVINDNASGISLPATVEQPINLMLSCKTSEKIEMADSVCQDASVSTCSYPVLSTLAARDHCSLASSVTVFEHLACKRSDNTSVVDADVTDAADKPCTADGSGNNLCRVLNTASCAENIISRCIIPCANTSSASDGDTESQNSSHKLSSAQSANS